MISVPGSIAEKFTLYEQTITPTEDCIEVDLGYTSKMLPDIHGLVLQLHRPGELSFCDIVIEYRNGSPVVYISDPYDMVSGDPQAIRPLDKEPPFCLKCGWAWELHNGDGSCVEEE